MQIKTTMTYHYSSVRLAIIKKARDNMLPKKREPCKLLKGIIIRSAIMENSMKFPQKTKYKTAFDPAILLLGIYPKEMKAEY